jgi:hypothetical protein
MSTGGDGGQSAGSRDASRSAKRACADGSATLAPPLWRSRCLKEVMAVKHSGPGGREASLGGKGSPEGLALSVAGWWAVTV